jgi:hypothetical protein
VAVGLCLLLTARLEKVIRETEKPKVLGCFSNNLFNKVDFPEPEGPEMTIGLAATIVNFVFSKVPDVLCILRFCRVGGSCQLAKFTPGEPYRDGLASLTVQKGMLQHQPLAKSPS